MITVRHSRERGVTELDWLKSRHTFSFGTYYDPGQMGFRSLRVINDDNVAPGGGFDTHPHQDMEILTYVLDGALEHRDSLGTGSVIRPNDVQLMSAGSGIRHSEFNHSKNAPVHFLQVWITPEKKGLTPSYAQSSFTGAELQDQLCLIAADQPTGKAVKVQQNLRLYAARLSPGTTLNFELQPKRAAWIQLASGAVRCNGTLLETGDGAALYSEAKLEMRSEKPSELLLFDLQ